MALPECIIERAREESRSDGSGSRGGDAEHKYKELRSSIGPQSFVIPGEEAGELEVLIQSYRETYSPERALEWFLVDALIAADWEMRRMRRMRGELLRKEMQAGATLAEACERPALVRLERRQGAVERSFHRAFKELQWISKQETEARKREEKEKKEQGRTLVATLPEMAKLASFRHRGERGKGGPLRPADAGAPGRVSAPTAGNAGPEGPTPREE
jgi:hypothetical protein